jgi:hypothetical protein
MAATSTRRAGLVLVAAIGILIAGCGGDRLTEFRSEEGRFRILLPGTPSEETLTRGIKTIRLQQRSGSFVVAWEDLKRTDQKMSPDERLDMACNAAVEQIRGKALSRRKTTLADRYPGRDLVAQGPDGNLIHRDRMYLVDGRLYQVLASGSKWWVESATVERVLDSFELIEE